MSRRLGSPDAQGIRGRPDTPSENYGSCARERRPSVVRRSGIGSSTDAGSANTAEHGIGSEPKEEIMATTDQTPTRPAATMPPGTLSLDTATVQDAMHRGVLSCSFETPLATVARMMATHHVHCVVGLGDVTEDDTRLWGVISDRDVLAGAAAGELARQTAGGSAATPVLTIGPGERLERAAEHMYDGGLTHVIGGAGSRGVRFVSTS